MSDERETPFGPEPDLQDRLGQLGDDPEMLELRADAAVGAREAELPGTSRRQEQELEADAAAAAEQRRQRRYLIKALLRSPTFMTGLIIVLFWVFMALFSTHITQDPYAQNALESLKSPSPAHWFGTDDLGRDVFARTMAGARTVLIIAPLATLLALLLGGIIGLIAGFWRGYTDDIIMRLIDVLLALPVIVTAILILSLLGQGLFVMIITIGILFTPVVSRTVRAAVIGEREREYVLAARLRGERSAFVMAREILPNITQPIIVEGTVRLGYAVFTAATLAFLGFGLEPGSPDWGLTISTERSFLQIAPWTVLFPALALASLVVAVNLITDGLGRTFSR
ncbi:MAG TPA: ABC transporter permease [Thermoleophilia bacterium]|nr:ABC transporter permease [Thermoleophilia bacterium]